MRTRTMRTRTMRAMSELLDARGRTRRTLILTGAAAMAGWAGRAPALAMRDVPGADPFTLGVASGDPHADGVVLWTRLAPQPLAADGFGGMPARRVHVRWTLATDEACTKVARTGDVSADPAAAHSVHVEVRGLTPGREYFYRFEAMGHRSRIGRTRTAPGLGGGAAAAGPARFGVVSCARYESGYFTAYGHLAAERPDLVLHLGDYVYEYAGTPKSVRPFEAPETTTLAGYRNRYALYRTDPDLQTLHATAPFAVVWDDHEVDNNWAGEVPEDGQTREQFLARRAVAFQAYYEMMPLRGVARPAGSSARLYRQIAWGDLASICMLDTRQFRDDQPCGDGNKPACEARLDQARQMLGPVQEGWLRERAARSRAIWDVLGQQVFFGELVRPLPDGRDALPMDSWNGYVAARGRVLDMYTTRPHNLVVLTGDVHRHFAGTLHAGGGPADAPVVGTEFVATSVTSAGDGSDDGAAVQALLGRNPNLRFSADRRGYLLADITPSTWTTHFRTVPWVTRAAAPVQTRASFVVEAGRPGLNRLS